jgi:hypothetical protein
MADVLLGWSELVDTKAEVAKRVAISAANRGQQLTERAGSRWGLPG